MDMDYAGLLTAGVMMVAFYIGRLEGRRGLELAVMSAEIKLLEEVNKTLDKAVNTMEEKV